jgi:hypothetical protein
MKKITVLSMITLDGIMQAPGGPEEDTSNGFEYGGWSAPYGDEVSGKQIFFWAGRLLISLKTTGLSMQNFGQVSMMSRNTSCPRPEISQIGKIQFSSIVC